MEKLVINSYEEFESYLGKRFTAYRSENGSVENFWGIGYALLPNRQWNQKQKT